MTLQKRLFDLALLLALLPLILALLMLVALVLWTRQGRPVFFGSERMHSPTRGFTLWKLRSMTLDARDSGVSGGDKSARITPIGRVLRRTRLDELPQALNILRGDVSFVGPRPPLRQYVEQFPRIYAQVLRSRPGVTGLATLVYAAHEERLLARCTSRAQTDATYARNCVPRKARLDLIYQRHQSLGLDLWLILMTARRVAGLARKRRFPRPPHRWCGSRSRHKVCGQEH
ncbi:MAG: sugar transferase [Roseinatronobacter sp.]